MQCVLFTILTFFAPIDSSVACTFQARILAIYEDKALNKEETKESGLDDETITQIRVLKMKIKLLDIKKSKNMNNECVGMIGKEGDISVMYNKNDGELAKGAIVNLDFIVIGGFAYYGIPPTIYWRIVPPQ